MLVLLFVIGMMLMLVFSLLWLMVRNSVDGGVDVVASNVVIWCRLD